jgi:mannose-6-phosphate isomerase-like protein (cupin superfamily)
MIITGEPDPEQAGRTVYPLGDAEILLRHFVIRETGPDNPFGPHEHEQPELWYMIEGEGTVALGGEASSVSGGTLVRIDPWVKHGLASRSRLKWICMG